MTERRQVRVSQTFFDRLDELLPAERSAEGFPSATDFLLHEIPAVIDRFAVAFDESTTPFVAGSDIRVLITAGVFARQAATAGKSGVTLPPWR